MHPGSSPEIIRLRFEGADRIEVDEQGDLLLHAAGGVIRKGKPHIYQLVNGRQRQIAGRYVLQQPQVSFEVGDYDPNRQLVIDPMLVYSTYLGGTFKDTGLAIAVDSAGNAYVSGSATAAEFPVTPGAFDVTLNGGTDAFVTKLNNTGSDLVYSTYLGGSAGDFGRVAVDSAGIAYVTGVTSSADFPTTLGAFDTTYNGGGRDAFVTKLDAVGSALLYSTYLGGSSDDAGHGIALDSLSNAFVTGQTFSSNFPTTLSAFDTTFNGSADGFVTKLNVAGSALVYSTYLGGPPFDQPQAIAVDSAGNAHVTGFTDAPGGVPTTPGAFDTSFNGGSADAFVTKLNAAGSALVYSTYLGGNDHDVGNGIALDSVGNAYVSGITFSRVTPSSPGFPTTPGAFDTTYNGGGADGFVTKLDAAGSMLVYSTYLGGNAFDEAFGIALDSTGGASVTGSTASESFPITPDAFDMTYDGGGDAFVAKLNAAGSGLSYSTFLGGTIVDHGLGIAVDIAGSIYVTGNTGSADYPTTPGAFDTTLNGSLDAFVTKIGVGAPATLTLDPPAATNPVESQHCVTATVKDAAGNPVPDVTVRFTVSGAVNTSGSATTDANGEARFCYIGPPLPGEDAITAFADTDDDGSRDAGEPSGAATKTWVLPATTPLCEINITNGGWIIAANGDRASFGGNAKSDENSNTQGQEEYQDHGPAQPFNMHSINVQAIVCDGSTNASIFGQATIDGSGSFHYRIRVKDLGEPGVGQDTYWLLLQTGYNSGEQVLQGGNVQIRRQ